MAKNAYDTYYQTEELFGSISPELLNFFKRFHSKGKVLDLGCGQGRDAIPIAKLGFEVTGIDNSAVGLAQLKASAKAANLHITIFQTDIYTFNTFDEFDFILLDSMFHFQKNDRVREVAFIKKILMQMKDGAILVFANQDSGNKINTLKSVIDFDQAKQLADEAFLYTFKDAEHQSTTKYRLLAIQK